MIARYALYDTAALSTRFQTPGLPKGVRPNYNVSPTVDAPVIILENGSPVVKRMKWGLLAKGAKDTNSVFRYKTYDTPSENIFSKHSWESAVREKRCLVPANGFYELNSIGDKRAFYAQPKDRSLCAFAGIYSIWQDDEGTEHGSFSLLTGDASGDMPNRNMRMPIILSPEDETRWLDTTVTDTSSIYQMLRPNPAGTLSVYEVSAAIHSPKSSGADLIARLHQKQLE